MRPRRRGATLIELTVVLALAGALLAVALPSMNVLRDRAAVRSATVEILSALTFARHTAVARERMVAVRFDERAGHVVIAAGADTIRVDPVLRIHGVALSATRDSIAYSPLGLGFGAANTSVTLRRGRAEDTVIVSRLGRVRH